MATIIHIAREYKAGGFSIERVFSAVRNALSMRFQVDVLQIPGPGHSRSWLLTGLYRVLKARGKIFHIVGDVHYAAIVLPKKKTIVTVHDLNRYIGLSGLRKIMYGMIYFRWPLSRCGLITVISEATRLQLLQHFPSLANKVVVIPNPLPIGFEVCFPEQLLKNKECQILHIGTAPHKNLERLIRALRGLPCVLTVVGAMTKEQRALATDVGVDVRSVCNLSDEGMLELYQRCDVVSFVSLHEGFGMPIIEAQAAGRPVVTSSWPPMDEVAGDGALKVDPMSEEEIRAAIQRLLNEDGLRRELRGKGLKNAQRYRVEKISRQYGDIYWEMLCDQSEAPNL